MARNYSIGEAVKIIAEAKDNEAIMDIGRRYPLLLAKASKAIAVNEAAVVELLSYMPEYISANKINKTIKETLLGDEDAEEVAEEKPVKKEKSTKKSKKEVVEDVDEDEVEDETEEDYSPYAGKTAPELYKECKARGIKVAAKKTADYYEKALIKADAKAAEANKEDWGEDEPEEKPAKKEKKTKKEKATKKPKKEEIEEETEDDDDWDI